MTMMLEQNATEEMPQTVPISTRPVKILLYYPDFGAVGGIERYILNVCQMLQSRGQFQPVVICSHDTPFYHQLRSANIETHGVKTLPIFARPSLRVLDIFSMLQLVWIILKKRPKLVHVHIGHLENLLFTVFFPTVYSFHGYGSLYSLNATSNNLKRTFKKIMRGFFRFQTRFLKTMLFVSQAEHIRMLDEDYLPASAKIKVLPNSIPIYEIQQLMQHMNVNEVRAGLNLPKDAYCLTFINRLDENKNPFLFIRLFEALCREERLEPLHCVIAGSGPLTRQVKEVIARSPYAQNIHFLGYYHPVIELLAVSDLVVHVPSMEGFGLGVLEAMATGTLCLAHNTGGIGELLSEFQPDQMLVPVGNFEALVKQAVHLLALPIEEKHRIRARLKQAASHYDNDMFMAKLEETYHHVLSAPAHC